MPGGAEGLQISPGVRARNQKYEKYEKLCTLNCNASRKADAIRREDKYLPHGVLLSIRRIQLMQAALKIRKCQLSTNA
jgi:hypothetical protein